MTYVLTDPFSALLRCPQCSTARPTLMLRHVFYCPETRFAAGTMVQGWAILQCTSCKDAVCFKGRIPYDTDLAQLRIRLNSTKPEVELMMPTTDLAFDDLPGRAGVYMKQAAESLATPDGAVMLAGSAVDAMLKEKGLTKGSVYARIEAAVKSNLLTPAMGEWAHAVRLSANNPRHADLDEPHATLDEARAAVDFAKALGQFLFVLPARIQLGKDAAEKATADAEAAQ